MQLTLNVVSFHRNTPGQQSSETFSTEGGTIGRAAECDWVLADPQRYLSSVHAEIVYADNVFNLIDRSTNGVFINKSSKPIGRNNRVSLKNGDHIEMGDFVFAVELSKNSQVTIKPNSSPSVSQSLTNSVTETSKFGISAYDADEALFKIDTVATPENNLERTSEAPPNTNQSPKSESLIPDNWYDNTHKPQSVEIPESTSAPAINLDDQGETVKPKSQATPAPNASSTKPSEASGKFDKTKFGSHRDVLLGALGIKPDLVKDRSDRELMELVGSMLRVSIQGYLALINSRKEIKSEIRANHTMIQATNNNPLKFSMNINDALFNLLSNTRQGFMPADQALKDAAQDIHQHQAALLAGTQGVIEAMLAYFSPDKLDKDEQNGLLERLLPKLDDAKAWRAFRGAYNELLEKERTTGTMLFSEEFNKAYNSVKK